MSFDTFVKQVLLLNNNLNDASGNNNGGEAYGSPTTYDVTIKHEGSHSLFVQNSYGYAINTGRGPTAPPASALTLAISAETVGVNWECWANYKGTGATDLCGVEDYQGPILRFASDGMHTVWNGSDVNMGNYNNTTEANTWIHWAWTYNVATDVFKVYKNNSLIYTRNSATKYYAGDRAILAGMSWNQAFYGYIDELIISLGIVRTTFPTLPLSEPFISDVSPASGTMNGGTSTTINGTGFVAGASVLFDATAATNVVVVSAAEITCDTPAHAVGLVDVTVTNTDTGTFTLENAFTFFDPSPELTSIYPLRGVIQGGETATLTGINFIAGAEVLFGSIAATNIVIVSSTSITCTTPKHVEGVVNVTVTTSAGTDTLTAAFTYCRLQMRKMSKKYRVYLNNTEITSFQLANFKARELVNFIDNYDFALDDIDIDIPIKFFNTIAYGTKNTIKIIDRYDNIIFYGEPYNPKYSWKNRRIKLTCAASISLFSKIDNTFTDIVATNGVRQLFNMLSDDNTPFPYTVINFSGLSSELDIAFFLNTNADTTTRASVLNQIFELLGVGLWIQGTKLTLLKIPTVWPSKSLDIEIFLNEHVEVSSLEEYRTDAVTVEYTAAVEGDAAAVTVGTGLTQKITIATPIYLDAANALKVATRLQKIFSVKYFETNFNTRLAFDVKIGTYVRYKGFTFMLLGKEVGKNSIKYYAKGVL